MLGLAGLKISTLRRSWLRSISSALRISTALPCPSRSKPSIKCSVPIKSCPRRNASSLLKEITSLTRGEKLSSIENILYKNTNFMSHNSKTIPQINFVITNDIKNYLKSKFLALNLLTLFLL